MSISRRQFLGTTAATGIAADHELMARLGVRAGQRLLATPLEPEGRT